MFRGAVPFAFAWAACSTVLAQAPAPTFRDCAQCPEMVSIPAGKFRMGAGAGEAEPVYHVPEARSTALPQRSVAVRGVALGRFEVTRGEYRAFATATRRGSDGCYSWSAGVYTLDPARSWENPGFAQTDDHPVVCVSWEDATAYAQWLASRTGRRYRLPSEAEWEYAARAGSANERYWTGSDTETCRHANGADASLRPYFPEADGWAPATCNDGHAYTAPVGSYPPNAFGLHDVLGNAAEWTLDCRNDDYRGAPVDGTAWIAGHCDMRMVRGGAWDDGQPGLRAAYRISSPVGVRVYTRGFRVARED